MAVRFLQPLHFYTAKFPDTHVELDLHAVRHLSSRTFRNTHSTPSAGDLAVFRHVTEMPLEGYYPGVAKNA